MLTFNNKIFKRVINQIIRGSNNLSLHSYFLIFDKTQGPQVNLKKN